MRKFFVALIASFLICPPLFGATMRTEVLSLSASEAAGDPVVEVVLPYANANGYKTIKVTINPTAEVRSEVVWDKSNPHIYADHEPFSVTREWAWPEDGVNVRKVKLDPGLITYVEIETPRGTRTAYHDLQAVTQADYYDFPEQGTFYSQIFVATNPGESGTVTVDGIGTIQTPYVTDAVAELVPVSGERVTVTAGYNRTSPNLPGPPSFYTFGIVEHDATGAITVKSPVKTIVPDGTPPAD